MKLLKKMLSFFIISILLFHSIKFPAYASPNTTAQSPVRVAVFLNSFNDPFISDVKKRLEDIQVSTRLFFYWVPIYLYFLSFL